MEDFRYGVLVTGVCRICSSRGKTEIHHIISQSVISKIERPDLLTNPGNLVELCKACHRLTDSHVYRRWIKGKNPKIESKEQRRERVRLKRQRSRERNGLFQCAGITRGGRQCEDGVKEDGGFCPIHR